MSRTELIGGYNQATGDTGKINFLRHFTDASLDWCYSNAYRPVGHDVEEPGKA
jgi:hypothetical protein